MSCSTKFAIEGITKVLAAEIPPFGRRALIVEPGYFRTNSLASASAGQNVAKPIAAYDVTVAHKAAANSEKYNGRQPSNPKFGAARIWEVVSGEGMAKGKKQFAEVAAGWRCRVGDEGFGGGIGGCGQGVLEIVTSLSCGVLSDLGMLELQVL